MIYDDAWIAKRTSEIILEEDAKLKKIRSRGGFVGYFPPAKGDYESYLLAVNELAGKLVGIENGYAELESADRIATKNPLTDAHNPQYAEACARQKAYQTLLNRIPKEVQKAATLCAKKVPEDEWLKMLPRDIQILVHEQKLRSPDELPVRLAAIRKLDYFEYLMLVHSYGWACKNPIYSCQRIKDALSNLPEGVLEAADAYDDGNLRWWENLPRKELLFVRKQKAEKIAAHEDAIRTELESARSKGLAEYLAKIDEISMKQVNLTAVLTVNPEDHLTPSEFYEKDALCTAYRAVLSELPKEDLEAFIGCRKPNLEVPDASKKNADNKQKHFDKVKTKNEIKAELAVLRTRNYENYIRCLDDLLKREKELTDIMNGNEPCELSAEEIRYFALELTEISRVLDELDQDLINAVTSYATGDRHWDKQLPDEEQQIRLLEKKRKEKLEKDLAKCGYTVRLDTSFSLNKSSVVFQPKYGNAIGISVDAAEAIWRFIEDYHNC